MAEEPVIISDMIILMRCCYLVFFKSRAQMGLKIGIDRHQINGRNNGEPSEVSQIRDVSKPAPE